MTRTLSIVLTHKGWFGICPVHIGNLHDDAPFIHPRHWLFEPLFWLCELFFTALFFSFTRVDPGLSPQVPLLVTGELATARVLEIDDDDFVSR